MRAAGVMRTNAWAFRVVSACVNCVAFCEQAACIAWLKTAADYPAPGDHRPGGALAPRPSNNSANPHQTFPCKTPKSFLSVFCRLQDRRKILREH